MTGYQSKKAAAQDKLDGMEREALKLALEALKKCRDRFFPLDQHETARDLDWAPVNIAIARCEEALAQPAPVQEFGLTRERFNALEVEITTLQTDWQSALVEIERLKAALAQPAQERNFCERCGKRTKDIHPCTPPQETI